MLCVAYMITTGIYRDECNICMCTLINNNIASNIPLKVNLKNIIEYIYIYISLIT